MLYHGVRRNAAGASTGSGWRCSTSSIPSGACCAATRGSSGRRRPTSAGATSATSCSRAAPPSALDGDTIHVYYGAADTSIGVATASLRHLLAWLDANSAPDHTSEADAVPAF